MADQAKPIVPPKRVATDYPIIDTDPHAFRCYRYARKEDYAKAVSLGAIAPVGMYTMEKYSPSFAGKGGFPPIFRLSCAAGAIFGAIYVWQKSSLRFYGWEENAREVEMDMKEMVAKVKKGEPLYGHSRLSPYMQGVAARNSRYSATFAHIIPWMNFVNHNQHGVDTAKYYQQAERELEAERTGKALA
ncbi:putative nadh-ubiquinone oxidoreductase 21 kda subunit [Phaeomoniella chlamydospora]|uniref:Putative nadh-ubiquinone oxidoreductase 21 kDa subunit n=1 Tax=Phaeomoniella chlamydospora TaxID=158046 RepID=A0A0G2E3C5_PHACM|nr:putative nadh-ubiquinone oxidoreductase 21 kda subunit [Phaeomoniella chlamydospora]